MEILCKHCGIGFIPKRKRQIYCSIICVGKYKAGLLCPKHNLKRTKWGHCPQCKRENGRRYESSKRGKTTARNYAASEKGKLLKQRNNKKYRSTPKAKEWMRQYRKSYNKSPEARMRIHIRQSTRNAIRAGRLLRCPCVVCNDPRTEIHHAWGYTEEHILHVVFLCRKHHIQADHDPTFNEELKSKAPVE